MRIKHKGPTVLTVKKLIALSKLVDNELAVKPFKCSKCGDETLWLYPNLGTIGLNTTVSDIVAMVDRYKAGLK